MIRLTIDLNGEIGIIDIRLHKEEAPITCENFEKLVKEGFYDGTIFHRIINNFMAQGGGYYLEGNEIVEKNASTIKGEFISNGVNNNIKHIKGVVSMARTQVFDSASSQFFICTTSCSHLDGAYAAFGSVVHGMDVVDKLNNARTEFIDNYLQDFPYPVITIMKAEII